MLLQILFLLVTKMKGELKSVKNKVSLIYSLSSALFLITMNDFDVVNTNHLFLASEASSRFS